MSGLRGPQDRAATRRSAAVSAWATTCSTTTSGPCRVRRRLVPRQIVPMPLWHFAPHRSWRMAESHRNRAAASPTLTPDDARAATSSFLPNNVEYPYSDSVEPGGSARLPEELHGRSSVCRHPRSSPERAKPYQRRRCRDSEPSLPTYLAQPSAVNAGCVCPSRWPTWKRQSHFNPAYTNAGFTNPIMAFVPLGRLHLPRICRPN